MSNPLSCPKCWGNHIVIGLPDDLDDHWDDCRCESCEHEWVESDQLRVLAYVLTTGGPELRSFVRSNAFTEREGTFALTLPYGDNCVALIEDFPEKLRVSAVAKTVHDPNGRPVRETVWEGCSVLVAKSQILRLVSGGHTFKGYVKPCIEKDDGLAVASGAFDRFRQLVGLPDCGLNADWNCSAIHMGPGDTANAFAYDLYVIDNYDLSGGTEPGLRLERKSPYDRPDDHWLERLIETNDEHLMLEIVRALLDDRRLMEERFMKSLSDFSSQLTGR